MPMKVLLRFFQALYPGLCGSLQAVLSSLESTNGLFTVCPDTDCIIIHFLLDLIYIFITNIDTHYLHMQMYEAKVIS